MLYLFLSIFSIINLSIANIEEKNLRNYLFTDYNNLVRPVKDYNQALDVSMGLGVQNLESFNQKEETIDINLWVRLNWNDNYLDWNSNISNLDFLSVENNEVWVPDIELLNAASLPDIYTLKGGMNLYKNGDIMWSNPAIFKFSCPLKLHYFPFDTQRCKMKFSSWIYNKKMLNLHPHHDESKQIDILNSFSHSEWEIKSVKVRNYNENRPCCPDLEFKVNEYTIRLRRYPHYYNISMGMTISLVIVNFIIMLIKPDNISRTSTAVFIPLTILALQLTLADKIPVVGYYTLMDYFFLCCFITSMICSIQSGLVYSLLTSKSRLVYLLFKDRFDLEKLIKKDKNNKNKLKKKNLKHKNLIDQINSINETDVDAELNNSLNYDEIDIRTTSYKEAVDKKNINNVKTKIIDEDINLTKLDDEIIKTINYDDITLTMTYKEILIFNEIERYVKIFDNICRVLIPIIFVICISVIFSYK